MARGEAHRAQAKYHMSVGNQEAELAPQEQIVPTAPCANQKGKSKDDSCARTLVINGTRYRRGKTEKGQPKLLAWMADRAIERKG